VLVVGTGDVETTAADVVDSLVVDQEGAVGVLNGAVGRENGIVRLDDGRGDARGRVDGKFELALLAVVGRKTLEQESAESGTSAAAERVEDQEPLEGGAVVFGDISMGTRGIESGIRTGDASNLVNDAVNHLLSNSVVTASVCA
jgi:hypothetical protein